MVVTCFVTCVPLASRWTVSVTQPAQKPRRQPPPSHVAPQRVTPFCGRRSDKIKCVNAVALSFLSLRETHLFKSVENTLTRFLSFKFSIGQGRTHKPVPEQKYDLA